MGLTFSVDSTFSCNMGKINLIFYCTYNGVSKDRKEEQKWVSHNQTSVLKYLCLYQPIADSGTVMLK